MPVFHVKLTALLTMFAIVGFNIFLTFDGVQNNTLSHIVRVISPTWPLIPFMYGFLGGHWFHIGTLPPIGFWPGFAVVVILAVSLQLVCKLAFPQGIPPYMLIVMHQAGVGCGMFFWPV